MLKRIWVEVLRHPDGCPKYSSRGQLYRTKLGDADGPVLCERTMTPTLDSCRALLACGITGPFETWHEGDSFARLTGDIANGAKLEVKEGAVRSVRYEPIATAEHGAAKPARLAVTQRRHGAGYSVTPDRRPCVLGRSGRLCGGFAGRANSYPKK